MGMSSSAAPPRPARRSIRFTFVATVALPVACLVALWALAVLFGTGLDDHLSTLSHAQLAEMILLGGGGLVVIIGAVVLMGTFARQLSRDLDDLADTARRLADEQLPRAVQRLRDGLDPDLPEVSPRWPRTRSTEIDQAATAISRLQRTTIAAAAGESGLRTGLRQVFVSLARRNQSLLQRQLRLIDSLEQKASDPAALADLFALDHLTTRMRRHAESLAILSGAAPGRSWTEPVPVIDVIRGAMAEVEDYRRVSVLTKADEAVAAPAVPDMIHLLAELIENAAMFSPSGTRVEVRAERVANGFAVEIDDRGLGIEPGQLGELNRQLAEPPDFDLANADRLGLFVGAKLAGRHGVRVSLRPSPYGGTSAIVLMPNSIVSAMSSPGGPVDDETRPLPGRLGALDLGSGGSPALAARRAAATAAAVLSPAAPGTGPAAGVASVPASGLDGRRAGLDGAPPSSAPPSGGAPSGGPPRLPQRTRQASLSPYLRDSPARAVAAGERAGGPAGDRSPEQARALAASLQTGWRRGRQGDPPGGPAAPGPRLGAPADRGEEA
ncbi:MAG TPA: ATP-binding protein [Streptosporangiaceae bacterium]|nr:ATP-binding protein [Streptosporangiaceae bacterium]